jgi:hypothetical protein
VSDIAAARRLLPIEAGATCVFDLGYYDFAFFAKLRDSNCIFVTRLKCNRTAVAFAEDDWRVMANGRWYNATGMTE